MFSKAVVFCPGFSKGAIHDNKSCSKGPAFGVEGADVGGDELLVPTESVPAAASTPRLFSSWEMNSGRTSIAPTARTTAAAETRTRKSYFFADRTMPKPSRLLRGLFRLAFEAQIPVGLRATLPARSKMMRVTLMSSRAHPKPPRVLSDGFAAASERKGSRPARGTIRTSSEEQPQKKGPVPRLPVVPSRHYGRNCQWTRTTDSFAGPLRADLDYPSYLASSYS